MTSALRRPPNKPNPNYDMALEVTRYRLAIEQATALLRLGRPRLALEVLATVEAPARLPPPRQATP